MFRPKPDNAVIEVLAARVGAIASAPASAPDLDVGFARQRAARQSVYRQAVLVLEQGERLPVVIRNVSDGGIRVEFFRKTPISDLVLVDEASLALRAWSRVAWQRDGASGLYFISR
jgi:hypothetical protein